jgi:hypothetical protein
VCSLRYPACNAHALYCHLWSVRLLNIFAHYLINGTIFGKKKVIEYKMCVLIYSITFVGSVLFLRRIERDVIKYMCWSSCKVLIILVRLVKFEFLDRFSKNTRISNFMKIRPMGTELFHADRRTNRHDKTNSRFSHLCEERLKYSLFQTLISK